jgi:hypothetical protein
MDQNEIINYLCSGIKELQNHQKEIKEQNRIVDFEEQNKTIDRRINECVQRFASDLVELMALFSQKNNGNPC